MHEITEEELREFIRGWPTLHVQVFGMADLGNGEIGNAEANNVPPQFWDTAVVGRNEATGELDLIDVVSGASLDEAKVAAAWAAAIVHGDAFEWEVL
jgi:hypothetical protein